MAEIFSADYQYLWAVVLAAALFLPVRRLIWTMMVRRASRAADIDEKEQARLHRRATFTATLLCFIFSFLYTATLFDGRT